MTSLRGFGAWPLNLGSDGELVPLHASVAVLATAAIAGFRAGYSARCRKPRYTEVGSALGNGMPLARPDLASLPRRRWLGSICCRSWPPPASFVDLEDLTSPNWRRNRPAAYRRGKLCFRCGREHPGQPAECPECGRASLADDLTLAFGPSAGRPKREASWPILSPSIIANLAALWPSFSRWPADWA